MSKINLVEEIYETLLKIGLPVLYEVRPDKLPCISYHVFEENGYLFGDGLNMITNGKLQIDIFDKNTKSVRTLRGYVIDCLSKINNIKILKTTPDELNFENDIKVFHHVVVFNFYYEESGVV